MRLIVGNVDITSESRHAWVCRDLVMDNFFTAHAALVPHGIHLIKGTGAFWDQTISNVLTEVINDEQNFDYVLTLDYDSVFEPSCLTKLMSTMLVSGVDAIAPLQTKRDDKHLMFTPEGFAGQNQITLPMAGGNNLANLVKPCTLVSLS